MKVYRLDIDTSKPIKQVVRVPSKSSKYGIAVKATADGMRIANPKCQMIINGSAIQSSKTLDDGSFLFELSSDMIADTHEVMFHVINMDELYPQDEWNGIRITYYFNTDNKDKTNLERVSQASNVIWYMKKRTSPDEDVKYFSDHEPLIFTDDTDIGHLVAKKVGNRVQNVYTILATIPKGTYYTKELDRLFLGGSIGRVADCKVSVILKEVQNPVPSEEIEDKNVVCDKLTVNGEEYVQTTVSINGVDYKVLAAPIEQS